MSWAGILKAIIAAKKAEAISKAMQSANEGMLDNSNTEGLGIDNMKNLISSMQGKSESTPTSDESLTKDTGSLTNGESLTKDTGSLIPVSETKSSSGDLGSVINQILGTKENQGEVNDTGIADYAKQQMDKNFKMKDAINEQALSELGLGDKIKEQNNLPLSEAKMAKFINPIDESSKDTFNNAFIDRFLKGKGRTMGEDTGNMAYVGDMLGDILRSRLGASDNTMTPKEKFEVMQMMEEYKKANPQAMDIAGTPQLGNSPLGMTSGYVQGQQGDPISQLAGRAQYQLKNRFLEETPESVDARALVKEAASKRIEEGSKLLVEAKKSSAAQELAMKNISDSTDLMSSGIRDAMLQSQSMVKGIIGSEIDPTRGLSGLAFSTVQNVLDRLGYNDYMSAIGNGLSTELAIEMGKQMGQGAGMRMGEQMVALIRHTLPNLKGDETLASNLNQMAYSLENGMRKFINAEVDEEGKPAYKTPEDRKNAQIEYKGKIREKLFSKFVTAGLYKPQMVTVRSPEGVEFETEDYMLPYWRDLEYKEIR